MDKEIKKTTLEKAIDLKGKVRLLIQSASEVANYLQVKEGEIQEIQEKVSGISDAALTAVKEKEALEKALKSVKKDFENESKALEEIKAQKAVENEKGKREMSQAWDEIRALKASLDSRETILRAKEEEVTNLRNALNAKLEQIAQIGGK